MPKRTNWKKLYLTQIEAHKRNVQVLDTYLCKVRRYEEVMTNNNVTITELQQQLAVQAKMLAEAQQDGGEAIARYNKYAGYYEQMRAERDRFLHCANELTLELVDAKLTLQYRIWHALTIWAAKTRVTLRLWVDRRRTRIRNWFAVRRLNKVRVSAMEEAGYIPEKLVKIALDYWEADKRRIKDGTEWAYSMDAHGEVKTHASLWRKFRILMGRA